MKIKTKTGSLADLVKIALKLGFVPARNSMACFARAVI